jgi:hypothetical protein
MKTPVSCPGCQRHYEVDERFAGKTVKCAYCEKGMLIPATKRDVPPAAPAAEEYELSETHEKTPSTFRPARARSDEDRADGKRPGGVKKKTGKRSPKRGRGRDDAESAVSLPAILIGLAVVAVVVALVGFIVPGVRKSAGVTLALPGLLLCIYGYATGAYIAFTEDDLYGWLYLLFPFYAAYYIVSRWDEMRSRLIMVGAGLALLAVGGQFLEADRAREEKAKETGSAVGKGV